MRMNGKYELVMNGIHAGRFASIKSLMKIGLVGQTVRSIVWDGNVCRVTTANTEAVR